MGKFAAVKIIVFATYYQSLLVALIPGMDVLGEWWSSLWWSCQWWRCVGGSPPFRSTPPAWPLARPLPSPSSAGSSERWNDFIICIEMCGFAIMHYYTFSHKEFLPGGEWWSS